MRELYEHISDDFKNVFYMFTCGNKSQRTYDEYIGSVNMLCNYLQKDFLDITVADAQKYMNALYNSYHDGTLSRKTISSRFACYRAIGNYIEENELIEGYDNPYNKIRRVEKPDDGLNPKKIPSLEELDMIMTKAKSEPMYFVILSLATRMGLSVSNILKIRKQTIIEEGGRLYIYYPGKNEFKNEMYIPIPDDVRHILEDYMSSIVVDEKGHIFFNKHKRPLTIKNVTDNISKIIESSDVSEKYTMKDLRSRAVLELVKAGATPNQISEYTGLSQLRIKTFVSSEHLIDGSCLAELVNYRLIT